jgi:hypothetical protein
MPEKVNFNSNEIKLLKAQVMKLDEAFDSF